MTDLSYADKSVNNPLLTAREATAVKAAVNSKLDKDPAWEDLREQLNGKNLYDTPGTADYDFANGWIVLQEGGAITTVGDVVETNFQLPHAVKTDSTAKLHLHWVQTTETTRTLTGRYRIQTNGATPASTWIPFTATCSDAEDNVFPWPDGAVNQITRLVEIDLTDVGISAIIQVQLARTDTEVNSDMFLLYMDMHVYVDSLGSQSEYVK